MDTVLSYLSNAFVAGAIGVVLGMVFGQKIKDFVTGVPSDFRSAMTNLEAKAKADVKAALADVFAKINPVAVKAPAPPAPAPPAPAPAVVVAAVAPPVAPPVT
jgi:hypothetical protein